VCVRAPVTSAVTNVLAMCSRQKAAAFDASVEHAKQRADIAARAWVSWSMIRLALVEANGHRVSRLAALLALKSVFARQASSISLLAAWRIPGVASFAATLFFCKLVAYTFLYWLPFYLSTTEIGGRRLSPQART